MPWFSEKSTFTIWNFSVEDEELALVEPTPEELAVAVHAARGVLLLPAPLVS